MAYNRGLIRQNRDCYSTEQGISEACGNSTLASVSCGSIFVCAAPAASMEVITPRVSAQKHEALEGFGLARREGWQLSDLNQRE